jgi:sirohydrochlorin cobaltochelatase
MKTIIVLAMHGAPPLDFPADKSRDFFALHSHPDHSHGRHSRMPDRFQELDKEMRNWPRNKENDPFWAGANDLRDELERASGIEVIIGFNEFCAPSLDEAFDAAASGSPSKMVVLTTMMTRGGEHSERDILQAVERAKARYTGLEITYVWPFSVSHVAEFLVREMSEFL